MTLDDSNVLPSHVLDGAERWNGNKSSILFLFSPISLTKSFEPLMMLSKRQKFPLSHLLLHLRVQDRERERGREKQTTVKANGSH
jgi:hypothetical protein